MLSEWINLVCLCQFEWINSVYILPHWVNEFSLFKPVGLDQFSLFYHVEWINSVRFNTLSKSSSCFTTLSESILSVLALWVSEFRLFLPVWLIEFSLYLLLRVNQLYLFYYVGLITSVCFTTLSESVQSDLPRWDWLCGDYFCVHRNKRRYGTRVVLLRLNCTVYKSGAAKAMNVLHLVGT